MKFALPNLLLNPNKFEYSLNNLEIEYLQEAKKDLIKKYYNLVPISIGKAVSNNLRRRIEIYGTATFLEYLEQEEKNIYFRNSNSITEKISLINNKVIIKNSLKLNIISEKTYNILNFFYYFSKNSSNEPINFEDLTSIVTLLDKNLFKLKIDYKVPEYYIQEKHKTEIFKTQTRRKNDPITYETNNTKRRKNDYINTQSKKIKKEDLFLINSPSVRKRRKDDLVNTPDTYIKKRKDDYSNIEQIPERRKDNIEKNPFLPRKRRKDDNINNQTIPNPKRRRRKDD